MPKRVYVHELDLMLKPDEARLLLEGTTRARSLIENPARHFLYRRIEDVAALGRTPESLRAQVFLDRHLRPMTDRALAAANIKWSHETMAKKARDQRKHLDALRVAFSHQSEAAPARSFAAVPLRRPVRERRA
jgi:hypothetical protein